jgi:cellulose synthase (UDP-forming)
MVGLFVERWAWAWAGSVGAVLVVLAAYAALTGRPARRVWMVVAAVATLAYWGYRLTTWDLHAPGDALASLSLSAAETLGLVQLLSFYRTFWDPVNHPASTLPAADDPGWPTVAVLVPTINESLAILRRTLTGCLRQSYPRERYAVYLCDDGDRVPVRELAETYGVHYLARPSHEDAKAGNLNWALAHSTGEIVVLFDADMVPKRDALRRLVAPLAQNTGLAFTQAPQAFFNPDPFQHNLGLHGALPNEQDFFMRELQAARARFNAVLFVGSNAAFRRTALEAIGGFPTGTITEDVATSMLLQARGWGSGFVSEIVAEGLAAESFEEFLGQRDRWCRGNLQVARRWNPLTLPGLSGMQRLIYTAGVLYWFFGVQKMIYLLAPVLYLDVGVRSVIAPLSTLAAFWIPAFLAQLGTMRRITRQSRTIWWSHVYEVVQAPVLAVAALAETLGWHRRVFRITRKDVHRERIEIVWATFGPLLVLTALSGWGMARAFDRIIHHGIASAGFLAFVLFWAAYNLVGVLVGLAVSVDWPRWRMAERFAVHAATTVTRRAQGTAMLGQLVDLSEGGAAIETAGGSWSAGEAVTVRIADTPIPGEIVEVQPVATGVQLRVRWGALTPVEYGAIFAWTYERAAPFDPRPDPLVFHLVTGLRRRWRGITGTRRALPDHSDTHPLDRRASL